jgi:hypothetical protein
MDCSSSQKHDLDSFCTHAYAEYTVSESDGGRPFSQRVLEYVRNNTSQVYGCYEAPGSGVDTRSVLFEFPQAVSVRWAKRILCLWMEPSRVCNESYLPVDRAEGDEWVRQRQASVVRLSKGCAEARFGRVFMHLAEPFFMVQVATDSER